MKFIFALVIVAFAGYAFAADVSTTAAPKREYPTHSEEFVLPKETLITRATSLIVKVDGTIKNLEVSNDIVNIQNLKTQEAHIKLLIAQLGATTETVKVDQLKKELVGATHKLGHTNVVLSNNVLHPHESDKHIPTKREVVAPVTNATVPHAHNADAIPVATLIANAKALIVKVDVSIKKMETEKNVTELPVFKTEEANLKKLIAELEAATDPAKITVLKNELNGATHRLGHKNGVYNGNVKEPSQ